MSHPARESAYLSICAVYRDEADYLHEWIEFHRLVGVDRFYLYDNGSHDHHLQVLGPYLDDGTVVLTDWPAWPAQIQAYDDCLKRRREDSRWIAFLDLDEFVFSPTGRPVAELLPEFEEYPGVGVNWALFGASGHRTKPQGLVIENFVRRTDNPHLNGLIKSIVDPRRVRAFCTPHFFFYNGGSAVDENGKPVGIKAPFSRSDSVSFDLLRINHYTTKSEEEYRRKLERGPADSSTQPPSRKTERGIARMLKNLDEVEDRAILRYVPQLRRALEKPRAA